MYILILFCTCPGKSQIENLTNDEFEMSSFVILLVLSRKRVSLGDILWNTTFWIEDLPLLEMGMHCFLRWPFQQLFYVDLKWCVLTFMSYNQRLASLNGIL